MSGRNPRLALTVGAERVEPGALGLSPDSEDLLRALRLLLDGSRSWEQVWGSLLVDGHPPGAIAASLAAVARLGLLEDGGARAGPQDVVHAQERLLGVLSVREGGASSSDVPAVAGAEVQALLAASEVALVSSVADLGAHVEGSLRMAGIGIVTTAPDGVAAVEREAAGVRSAEHGLVVCATHGVDREFPSTVNRVCLDLRVPALYFHVHGLQMRLGPLVLPGETACYECYLVRRDAALAPWERMALTSATDGGRLSCPLGVDWLTVDVVKHLTRLGEPVSRGRLLIVDYFSGTPEVHHLLRLPRCRVCGVPQRPATRLWDEPRVAVG